MDFMIVTMFWLFLAMVVSGLVGAVLLLVVEWISARHHAVCDPRSALVREAELRLGCGPRFWRGF